MAYFIDKRILIEEKEKDEDEEKEGKGEEKDDDEDEDSEEGGEYTYESDGSNWSDEGEGEGRCEGEGEGRGGDGLHVDVMEEAFHVPEGECVFVHYKDMYPNLLKLVMSVSSLLGVSGDEAELLLQHFKWNEERLLASSFFQDPTVVLIQARVHVDGKPSQCVKRVECESCFICMDDFSDENDSGFSLSCGHRFHRSCYAEYIENVVSDGPTCVEMTCPQYQCNLRISSGIVKELCQLSSHFLEDDSLVPCMDRTASGSIVPRGSFVYESYVKNLVKIFIEQSPYMRWCPAPGCGFIAVGRGVDGVTCHCSLDYCLKCQRPWHQPAPCELVQKWEEKHMDHSQKWLIINTKPCPNCNRRIEKNQGCNHMTCSVCRHGFCWVCMGDWATHNHSFYTCNKFKSDEGEYSDKKHSAKFELERLLHNFTRFENHRKALEIATTKKQELAAGIFPNCDVGMATAKANSLRDAFDQVVQCRRTLQYSYIIGYFAKHGTREHRLFELQQQMLESNAEALNHLTEKAEKHELCEDELQHVTNLSSVTKNFMSQMLNADDMSMQKT